MAQRLFEARIINPILDCIKKNIDYLTQKENLGQLAKLGYMYNTLWDVGRLCYGDSYSDFKALIATKGQCEDNPKYKLERCDVGTEGQFDLIYDAWGMHVSNGFYNGNFEYFKNIILGNKEYSELELLLQKSEKTMDDYINIYSHKDYPYKSAFKKRKNILDHLLCVIGNGYTYKNGHIVEKASGAGEDRTIYSQWEVAKFPSHIDVIVQKILTDPDVKLVLDASHQFIVDYKNKEKAKREDEIKEMREVFFEVFTDTILNNDELLEEFKRGVTKEDVASGVATSYTIDKVRLSEHVDELCDNYFNGDLSFFYEHVLKNKTEDKKNYQQYYPISDSSIIGRLNNNSHPSYLKVAFEIIEEILENEKDERPENVKFAKRNYKKFKALAEK